MGYRSDVGICVVRINPNAPSIPEMMALAKTKGIDVGAHWNSSNYGRNDDEFAFYVEYVKWDDSYHAVKIMEELVNFFEDASRDEDFYSGIHCRIGEDTDDVETHAFGANREDASDRLYTTRSIARSVGFTALLGNIKETNL